MATADKTRDCALPRLFRGFRGFFGGYAEVIFFGGAGRVLTYLELVHLVITVLICGFRDPRVGALE